MNPFPTTKRPTRGSNNKDTATDSCASRIATWQLHAGRHDLPWQHNRDPYRIWLSEIMLQQTRASTVVPYYERFLQRFPSVQSLAEAALDEVLRLWAGLGYYARARNLHRCARLICSQHNGRFPTNSLQLAQLPGIGPSTAAAIAAFAWGERVSILDGNVRRVLIRFHALDIDPSPQASQKQLQALADAWLHASPPTLDMRAYTQGLMDLGATLCTRSKPACHACPLADDCLARARGLQNELPVRVRRGQKPVQHRHVLLAHNGSDVLLQRRPDTGVWAGLWSLPEFCSEEELRANCLLPGTIETLQKVESIRHELSHFTLQLQPYFLRFPAGQAPLADLGEWIDHAQLARYGKPAPIERLLANALPSPRD